MGYKTNLFLRFLIPYVSFLLIPLVIGLFVYSQMVTLMETEMVTSNTKSLEQIKNTVERRLSEIMSINQQIASNPKISRFQYLQNPFDSTFGILNTRKELYDYSLSNNFLINYYVIFKNSSMVLSNGLTYSLSDFYSSMLHYEQYSYQEWLDMVLGDSYNQKIIPASQVTLEGKQRSAVTYLYALGQPNSMQGAIVILLDNDELVKLMNGFQLIDGAWAQITDSQGNVISSVSNNPTHAFMTDVQLLKKDGTVRQIIDGKEMLVTFTTSKEYGWTFSFAQPSEIVLSKLQSVKRDIWLFFNVSLVLGMLIAYVLANRNSRPLKALTQTLAEKMGGLHEPLHDAYGFIQKNVSHLIENNLKLEADMKEQRPLLKSAFFHRLLLGGFIPNSEWEALFQHTKVEWKDGFYVGSLICLKGYDGAHHLMMEELDKRRVLIKHTVRNQLGGCAHIFDMESDKLALIIHSEKQAMDESHNEIQQLFRELSDFFQQVLCMNITITVGNIYGSMEQLSRSYAEAWEAYYCNKWNDPADLLFYDDIPKNYDTYYYPLDIEVRLVGMVKGGTAADVQNMLKELYIENFEQRQLSGHILKLFLFELLASLVKLVEQTPHKSQETAAGLDALSAYIEAKNDPQQAYAQVTEAYKSFYASIHHRKKHNNEKLIEEIKAFLETNFSNPDLNLNRASEQFQLTETYFSQFFKEHTGHYFSDYLETLRMDCARRKLGTKHLPVHEIAAASGYNTMNTFGRAFKRVHGMTPNEYRKYTTSGE